MSLSSIVRENLFLVCLGLNGSGMSLGVFRGAFSLSGVNRKGVHIEIY